MLLHSDLLIKTANQRILYINSQLRKKEIKVEERLYYESIKTETEMWRKTFEGLAEEGKMPVHDGREVKVLKLHNK